jgi:hypothetical protein
MLCGVVAGLVLRLRRAFNHDEQRSPNEFSGVGAGGDAFLSMLVCGHCLLQADFARLWLMHGLYCAALPVREAVVAHDGLEQSMPTLAHRFVRATRL